MPANQQTSGNTYAGAASLQKEQELESKYVIHTYNRSSVEFVEGHGMTLVDSEGKEYLDFLGGIAVACMGHSNPAIVAAVCAQASKLMQTSNYFYADGRGELAAKISGLLSADAPGETFKTFFCNSGGEANEGAFKLARRYADMRGSEAKTILYLKNSFHGRTLATIAATGQPSKQDIFRPLPGGFVEIPQNDVSALEKAISDGSKGAPEDAVCGVIIECIQGESGIWPCSQEFVKAIRELTSQAGAAMIVDEVQTGFYRTGKPFSFMNYGVVPDIVSMAKGIGGGFPMGAFAGRAEVADALQPGDHGSTFGGNLMAIAASNATLDQLESSDIASNVIEVGAYLKDVLASLPHVVDVRGMGLMLGAQLDIDRGHDIVDKALGAGLVLNAPKENILRFVPPLICSKDDVDKLAGKLGDILSDMD